MPVKDKHKTDTQFIFKDLIQHLVFKIIYFNKKMKPWEMHRVLGNLNKNYSNHLNVLGLSSHLAKFIKYFLIMGLFNELKSGYLMFNNRIISLKMRCLITLNVYLLKANAFSYVNVSYNFYCYI